MTIEVLLFAQIADALGKRSFAITLEPKETLAGLVRLLEREPGWTTIAGIPLMLAVNMVVVDEGHVLQDGDKVALLTPVSGG